MKKILLIVISIFILFSCSTESKISEKEIVPNNTKKTIYTSFYPIYFLTKSLVWNEVNVVNLVPAWWEPHEFEPTLKQIADMQDSDLIILNWLWMENYEEKLLEKFWNSKIVLLSEELDNLIHLDEKKNEEEKHWHEHWNTDPHTWLSPKTYLEMANKLDNELKNKWFKTNTWVIEKIKELEENYEKWLSNCNVKQLVTSHEAFWYLARDFWLTQHPVFWISPEEEPTANDIKNVVDLIKKDDLKYIFSEEFVSVKFANTITQETWSKVLTLHPLETLSDNEEKSWEDYISIMNKNLEKLKTWLDCK